MKRRWICFLSILSMFVGTAPLLFPTNSELPSRLRFLIGTCWPQLYSEDPSERLEQLQPEREAIQQIKKQWEAAWVKDEKQEADQKSLQQGLTKLQGLKEVGHPRKR